MGRIGKVGFAGLGALATLSADPAFAQSVPTLAATPAPETLSLTPQEKADIVSHQTEASVDAARAGLGSGGGGRQVHGEIGAMIGTRGARGIYGAAAIPLGDHADAVVSFEDSRYGTKSRR